MMLAMLCCFAINTWIVNHAFNIPKFRAQVSPVTRPFSTAFYLFISIFFFRVLLQDPFEGSGDETNDPLPYKHTFFQGGLSKDYTRIILIAYQNQSTYMLMPRWCLVPRFLFTLLNNPWLLLTCNFKKSKLVTLCQQQYCWFTNTVLSKCWDTTM